MNKFEQVTQEQLKELLEDIYLIGQLNESIVINDFINVVENKILTLIGKDIKMPSK